MDALQGMGPIEVHVYGESGHVEGEQEDPAYSNAYDEFSVSGFGVEAVCG